MNPIFHCTSCIVLCVCEQPSLDNSRAAAIGLIGFRPVMYGGLSNNTLRHRLNKGIDLLLLLYI
jgi:hypothetical protein